jgi:small-conductance mechanosensitive channel
VHAAVPRYRWAKYSSYAITILAIVVLAQVWFTAIRSVGVFLGLLSAGLAIALKDLVASLAGWFFILWRKPFDLGDRIQVGTHAGDVVDIRLFAFTIMEVGNWAASDQATGRMIHLPNSRVFTEPVANYTADFPFLWNEMPVLVTFESDWRRAKERLQEILDDVTGEMSKEAESRLTESSRLFLIHHGGLMPAVFTSVQESGVLLTGRYVTRPRERRTTSRAIWERVLDAFQDEPAIAFAYPTQRLRLDAPEGAPAPSQAPTVEPGGSLPAR